MGFSPSVNLLKYDAAFICFDGLKPILLLRDTGKVGELTGKLVSDETPVTIEMGDKTITATQTGDKLTITGTNLTAQDDGIMNAGENKTFAQVGDNNIYEFKSRLKRCA